MNNSKKVSTKTTSAIFLAIVLVAGIFVISTSSFMMTANAQGQPYYGIDNNYQKPYGKNNNYYDQSQYPIYGGKDNGYNSQKDFSKSISINKIKCANDNININGNNAGNFSIGNKGKGYLDANSYSGGYYDYGYNNNKQDKGFDCTINNNNTNTNIAAGGGGGNQTIPPTATTLTVKKQVFACTNFEAGEGETDMDCRTLQNNDEGWFLCTHPAVSTSGPCQGLPPNLFDIEVLDDQNNQIQQFEGSLQGTTIQNLEPGTYTVNEIKVPSPGGLGNQAPNLEINAAAQQACIEAGFPDGGALDNDQGITYISICIEYEDEQGNDCSTVALAAEEEKTCIVKNYIRESD